jgi:hypothetical protein
MRSMIANRRRVIDKEHPGFWRLGRWMVAEGVVLALLIAGTYLWKRFG